MSVEINVDSREARLWAQRVWNWLMPKPRFHSPSPEIDRPDEKEWQWWHIPMSVTHNWPRRDIPACQASAVFLEGNLTGKEIRLRWRSDLERGSSEINLLFDHLRYLPLVARRDNSPNALMTDNEWLMRGVGDYTIAGITGKNAMLAVTHRPGERQLHHLNPGVHKLRIKIISGKLIWTSEEVYEIRVPNEHASNSHFSVTKTGKN